MLFMNELLKWPAAQNFFDFRDTFLQKPQSPGVGISETSKFVTKICFIFYL